MTNGYYTQEEKNALNRRYYHERKERIKVEGICRSCKNKIGTKSTVFCDPCYDKAVAARRARTGAMPRKPRPDCECERCKEPKRMIKALWHFDLEGQIVQPCKRCQNEIERERKRKRAEIMPKTGPKRPPRSKASNTANAPINYGLLTTMKERQADPERCLAQDILTVAILDHHAGQCDPDFWTSYLYELCCDVLDWHPDYIKRNIGVTNAAKGR